MKEMSVKSRGKKPKLFPSLCREKTESLRFLREGTNREISLFRSEGKNREFSFFSQGKEKLYI